MATVMKKMLKKKNTTATLSKSRSQTNCHIIALLDFIFKKIYLGYWTLKDKKPVVV